VSKSDSFMRAWRDWWRLQTPVDNFRRGRRDAPTYGLECDLDHIASSVATLGSAYMSRKDWDFVKRGIQELQELAAVHSEAQALGTLQPEHRSALMEYLQATEGVLRALFAAEDPAAET
jgi:hypothetical protein